MEAVFLKLLNMSIAAGWLVLAVVVLRFVLKKAPKYLRVVLWALVGVRLLCPFSLESVLSLIPSGETVPPDILYTPTPAIDSGVPIINSTVNPVISEAFAPDPIASVNPMQVVTFAAAVVWVVGMAGMLLYTLVSYLRLKHRVREAAPLSGNIWLCDRVETPFILGIVRPRIYLPSAMEAGDRAYVIAHERAHLRRHDHWWKPLGFLLLTVYWFNPVLWLAYVLLCRDIELACDEKVIRELGADCKKPYSEALIHCSVPRRLIAACPLAFGEVGVKSRIRSVLNYKKPAFWVILVAVAASVVVAVCFLTDPKSRSEEPATYENGQVLFYTETTEEGATPPYRRSATFSDEELDKLVALLKKQKWVNDAFIDRVPFQLDGKLRYDGWLYFGYEDRVLLYDGAHDTYSCTATDEVMTIFLEKAEVEPPSSRYSQVTWRENADGTVSVTGADGETVTEYTVLQRSKDASVILAKGEEIGAGYALRLLTRGETTGLQHAFVDPALGAELYVCNVDGDGQDEIVVHQCVGMSGGAGSYVSYVFKTVGDELRTLFVSNPDGTYDAMFNSGFVGYGLEHLYTTNDGRKVPAVSIGNKNTGLSVLLDASEEDWSAHHYDHEEIVAQTTIELDAFFDFTPQDVNGDGVYEIKAAQYAWVGAGGHPCGIGNAHTTLSFNTATGTFDVIDAYFETDLPVLSETWTEPYTELPAAAAETYATAIASCESVIDAVLSDTFERDRNNGTLSIPSPNKALAYEWDCMIVEATMGLDDPSRRSFGYVLKDINGDEQPELFFVRKEHTVLAVFTLYDGAPLLLDAYWSRHRCFVTDEGFLHTHSSGGASDSFDTLDWLDGATGQLAEMRRFGYENGVSFETVHGVPVTVTEERLNEILAQLPHAHGNDWLNTTVLHVR